MDSVALSMAPPRASDIRKRTRPSGPAGEARGVTGAARPPETRAVLHAATSGSMITPRTTAHRGGSDEQPSLRELRPTDRNWAVLRTMRRRDWQAPGVRAALRARGGLAVAAAPSRHT